MSTPLMSSWLKTLSVDGDTVTLTTKEGQKLRYRGVPEAVSRAIQTAGSPGRIWHVLLKGRYQEEVLS